MMDSAIDRRSLIAGLGAAAVVAGAGMSAVAPAARADEAETPWGEATPVEPFVCRGTDWVVPAPAQPEVDNYATLDDSYYAAPAGLLEGKVAVITGATSGSGREMARLFAREGAKVVAVGRREDRLRALMAESADYAGEIAGFKADLSDRGQVQQMVDFAYDVYGKIDILVNNAAWTGSLGTCANIDVDEWDYVFALDLNAPFLATKAVLPGMIDQGSGNIINIASIGGKYGPIGGCDYSSVKAALLGLTRSVGYVYQTAGVRCNAICPGGFDTECSVAPRENDPLGVEMGMKHWGARQYSGKPQEVANVALFLASDASSYVNAQEVVCDGAWTAGQ